MSASESTGFAGGGGTEREWRPTLYLRWKYHWHERRELQQMWETGDPDYWEQENPTGQPYDTDWREVPAHVEKY